MKCLFFKEALSCNFFHTVDYRFTFIIKSTFIGVYGFSNTWRITVIILESENSYTFRIIIYVISESVLDCARLCILRILALRVCVIGDSAIESADTWSITGSVFS